MAPEKREPSKRSLRCIEKTDIVLGANEGSPVIPSRQLEIFQGVSIKKRFGKGRAILDDDPVSHIK